MTKLIRVFQDRELLVPILINPDHVAQAQRQETTAGNILYILQTGLYRDYLFISEADFLKYFSVMR